MLLEDRNWINDTLISFWFQYLQQGAYGEHPNLLFIDPAVTQLVKLGDTEDLPYILNTLDVKHKEYIFLPVNNNDSVVAPGGSHWSLLIYKKSYNKWYHFDSQQGFNSRHAHCLVTRFIPYLNGVTPPTIIDTACTQQDNGYDCGAFVMLYAQIAANKAVNNLPLDTCYIKSLEANKIRQVILKLIRNASKDNTGTVGAVNL